MIDANQEDQDRKEAISLLEELQNYYRVLNGIEPDPEQIDDDILKSIYEAGQKIFKNISYDQYKNSIIKQTITSRKKCPSRSENLNWYVLLDSLINNMEKSLDRIGFVIPDKYLFGSLYTGRLNGSAYMTNNSYKLILIENGLFGFANMISKVLSKCIILNKEDGRVWFSVDLNETFERIERDEEIRTRLWELLHAYLFDGNPYLAKRYMINDESFHLYEGFRNSFEYFVLGHEFGHLICGHLNRNVCNLRTIDETEYYEINIENWNDEIEADMLGMRLSFETMKYSGYDYSQCFCGPELFFSSVELIENSLDVIKYGSINPLNRAVDTHPPIAIRRETLRKEFMKNSQSDILMPYFNLSFMIEKIIIKLWDYLEPKLRQEYLNSNKPAAIWQY